MDPTAQPDPQRPTGVYPQPGGSRIVMDLKRPAKIEKAYVLNGENGQPPKPFNEWLRSKCSSLEAQNASEWSELHLVWEMINHFINGDQLLRRGHRFGGWVRVPH